MPYRMIAYKCHFVSNSQMGLAEKRQITFVFKETKRIVNVKQSASESRRYLLVSWDLLSPLHLSGTCENKSLKWQIRMSS